MSRAVDISDRVTFFVAYHAWALARAGHVEEARLALAELETACLRAVERPSGVTLPWNGRMLRKGIVSIM